VECRVPEWLRAAGAGTVYGVNDEQTQNQPTTPTSGASSDASSDATRGIDVDRVSAWLVANVAGAVAPFRFDLIAGGRSNITYKVTGADGTRFVVRRPPLGHVLATAHDMAREHRIISAVAQTKVPVAPALGLCTDEAVNGAPFYVMAYIDGIVLDSPEAGQAFPGALRRPAAESMIDVMIELHKVNPDDIGLGQLGRKEGYIERQLKRWSTQWANSKTRELPSMDRLHELLSSRMPEQIHTGIVHGDYRLGNTLVSTQTGLLQAVLDWELCTLGDTMADIGYLLIHWADPGAEPKQLNDPSGAIGFPTRAEVIDRYSRGTGRDLSGIGYYEAFSCWRLACIGEGVLARYKAGVMGEAGEYDTALGEANVGRLADRALAAFESLP
jgi:aminoglycoside phosphotransferase (APT) family kinase protein